MMTARSSATPLGRVASLHLHPPEPGAPLQSVSAIEVSAGKGILGEPRYFDRRSRGHGEPNRRQISLIEREQIAEHALALGLKGIVPGAVRANVETVDVDLIGLVGRQVQVGEAILYFYEPRQPCAKMDAICRGLRALMEPNKQGVMAQVLRSGKICAGDPIQLFSEDDQTQLASK